MILDVPQGTNREICEALRSCILTLVVISAEVIWSVDKVESRRPSVTELNMIGPVAKAAKVVIRIARQKIIDSISSCAVQAVLHNI